MRSMIIVILGFFLIGSSVTAQTRVTDKDVFIKRLFTVISNKDTAAFLKLFPDFNGFKRVTSEYINSMNKEDREGLTKILDTITAFSYQETLLKELPSELTEIYEKGKRLKVNWSSSVMTGWEEKKPAAHDPDALKIKMIKGNIYFTSNAKEYSLGFSDIIWSKTDQCWYGASLHSLNEKGKNDEFEDDVKVFNDTTITVDSLTSIPDTIPSPPKKPINKNLKKPPVKKTTTTKSEAKKPSNN